MGRPRGEGAGRRRSSRSSAPRRGGSRTGSRSSRYPIREGEHAQTAFAFGLVLDWARGLGRRRDGAAPLGARPRPLREGPRAARSPTSPRARISSRRASPRPTSCAALLAPPAFAAGCSASCRSSRGDGGAGWLPVGTVTDPSDGKLAHLDGLNLSRAWMLDGMIAGLPPKDARRLAALRAARDAHAAAGLAAVTGAHYEGGHWLGTFAAYLATRRGLRGARAVTRSTLALLFVSAVGAGIMNALAGGGTLLTFPALSSSRASRRSGRTPRRPSRSCRVRPRASPGYRREVGDAPRAGSRRSSSRAFSAARSARCSS